MNAKEISEITNNAISKKNEEKKREEIERKKTERQWEKKKPERIKSEYDYIMKEILDTAKEGQTTYLYKGESGNGVSYPEVIPMLESNGFKVDSNTTRKESMETYVTADGYDWKGSGNWYNYTELIISWKE